MAAMRIRSHLLLLAFGAGLPLAVFSVYLTNRIVDREQQIFADGAIERLRSTMNAIDAQGLGQVSALSVLAASRSLDAPGLESFGGLAERLLETHAWTNLIMREPRV